MTNKLFKVDGKQFFAKKSGAIAVNTWVSVPGEGAGDEEAEESKPEFTLTITERDEFISKIIKAESAYTVEKLHVDRQGDYTPPF